MEYIANHTIIHNGKTYYMGDVMTLTYEEAQLLLRHKSVSKKEDAAAEAATDDGAEEKPKGRGKGKKEEPA